MFVITLVHNLQKDTLFRKSLAAKLHLIFAWSNGSTASSLQGLHGGAYAVTITDANGCVNQSSFNVIEKVFELDVTADQTEIELGEEVHFNSNVTGGSGTETLKLQSGIFLIARIVNEQQLQ